MDTTDNRFGTRLRAIREQFGWTQEHLARIAGVGVRTIRRIEQMEGDEQFYPRFSTAHKLATALHVRIPWLLWDEGPMLSLGNMTPWEQHREQSGPVTEGLPGYVIVDPGGPWFRDANGEWQVRISEGEGTGR